MGTRREDPWEGGWPGHGLGGDDWVEAVSLGHRWLEKSHAARVKVDTKMESKDEDRNGLGTGESMQGTSMGPKKKDAEA